MAILPELQAHILASATGFQAGSAVGSTGVPIFLGQLPAEQPDRAVALYESGGLPPMRTMGSTGTGVDHEQPSIQVLNRAPGYAQARADARTIYGVLSAVKNSTLTSVLYVDVIPVQTPFDLPQDSRDRQVFSCNYTVQKEES